jgi:hypothetical protein
MNSSGLLGFSYLSIGPSLNLSGQTTCLSSGAKAWNVSLLDGVGTHPRERRGGDDVLAMRHLLSSMTLQKVSWITTIFALPMVLSYPPTSIIVDQMSIFVGRGCFFISCALRPIGRPVANGGLTPMVPSQWFCCNNLARRFGPLLSQSNEWRVH